MHPANWNLSTGENGQLVMRGCDLADLADRYGTPLHVVDQPGLLANYHNFADAFRRHYERSDIFFSYKTNCVPGLLDLLHGEGCGAEVISPYELWLALTSGLAPDRIIFNGVCKTQESLRLAIQSGVRLINIDSIQEAQRIVCLAEDLQRSVNVGIRIYPRIGWRGQFGVETSGDELVTICRNLQASPYCNLCCVAGHFGSGIRHGRDHRRIAQQLCQTANRIKETAGSEIDSLDLGGGFGVPTVKTLSLLEVALYKLANRQPAAPHPSRCASVETFAMTVSDAIRRECRRAHLKLPTLILEPGRVISSSAQVLLVRVQDIKRRGDGRQYLITDGGMQNMAFPLSYEYHHCFVANRPLSSARHRYFVTGSLCSPADILYRNWRLPQVSVGDVLAIMDAGAYFTSFANNFAFPRPPVAVVGEGDSRLVVQRETFDQLTRADVRVNAMSRP